MALPDTRNETYVDVVTPIPAKTMNDLQDSVIELRHGLVDVRENWLCSFNTATAGQIANYGHLSAIINGGTANTGTSTHSLFGGASGQADMTSGTAGHYAGLRTNNLAIKPQTTTSLVWEASVFLTAVTANSSWWFGFGSGATPHSGSSEAFWFRKLGADTNWQAVTMAASVSTFTNTNVLPVANTPQRFQIRYDGSGTPIGAGSNRVRFFIDGVERANHVTNVTTDVSLYWFFTGLVINATTEVLRMSPWHIYR